MQFPLNKRTFQTANIHLKAPAFSGLNPSWLKHFRATLFEQLLTRPQRLGCPNQSKTIQMLECLRIM